VREEEKAWREMQNVTFEIRSHPINARSGGSMEGRRPAISRKWLISRLFDLFFYVENVKNLRGPLGVWAAWGRLGPLETKTARGQAKFAFRASGDDLASTRTLSRAETSQI
jgi:hypothetical protein